MGRCVFRRNDLYLISCVMINMMLKERKLVKEN